MKKNSSYGRTWWGNAWVEAMERIDYDTNRLPRGRRYANNGSVKAVEVKDGVVLAKVQGSRPQPYNIKIKIKEFSNSHGKQIREVITSHPAMASELCIGKLPSSLLTLLEEKKIHILPQSWKDISADCSCPDWANPCKHLAAVYYILANEIDKNPFLIFNLRGLSTEALTASAGIISGQTIEQKTKMGNMFISHDKIDVGKLITELRILNSKPSLDLPDLSLASFDIESIFSLLPDNPLFYSKGDFKKILLQTYKSILKGVESIDMEEESVLSFKNTDFYLIHRHNEIMFFVTPHDTLPQDSSGKIVSLKIPLIANDKLVFKKAKGREFLPSHIFTLFLNIPLDMTIENNSLSSGFLNVSTSVALAFIRSASFIPEVVGRDNEEFSIRYVPLIHDKKGQAALDYLKSIMPPTMCFREEDNSLMMKDGVYDFLSLVITNIVRRFMDLSYVDEDKITTVFFRDYSYKVERFEEKQTHKSISDWIERISVRKKDVSPVIRVEIVRNDKFALTIDLENKKDPLLPIIPLSKVFDSNAQVFSYPVEVVRTEALRQISIAAEYLPQLMYVLNSRGIEKAMVTSNEMADFMTKSLDILELLGIRVIIPKEFKKLVMPRLAIKVDVKDKGSVISYLSLNTMLDFSWEVAIGDKTISKDEFLKMARSAKGIVKFKEEFLLLEPGAIKNILDKINKPLPGLSSMDLLHSAFSGEAEGVLFDPKEAVKSILDELTKIEDINIPLTLNAHLRPYQERGFKWLYSNTIKGFGSCIADDMGLGKTIQVITLILRLKEDKKLGGHVLVVCPTTIIGNWQKECERFAPSLDVSVYHGTERNLILEGKDLVITSYGILRQDITKFKDEEWGLVVVDESQNIKNPDADQTKAVKSLKSHACIAMSGTPVENRLIELWSIFDFINRGYLGPLTRFQKEYAIPIEKYRDRGCIEKFRRATAPFLLRRLKADKTIISDLPDKAIFDEYCYLSKEQTALYKEVVDATMREIEKSAGIERKGLVFKLITSLKQVCNHPVHYSKRGKPVKELSGKSEKTVEVLEKILAMREKALIFTQYKEMGVLLVDMIKNELKKDALFFHGSLPRAKRDRIVTEFQEDETYQLMVVSLKAGGTGLNLTAATNVIHYDLWWNPAVEAQATDRTYRIGQTKNVIVYRLITIGTFEEKIDEMLKAKKELADLTVTTGEQRITELSNKDLKEIFSLGSGNIKTS